MSEKCGAWRHHGLIWKPAGFGTKTSHAGVPTPMWIAHDHCRVFVSVRDSLGRARPVALDFRVGDAPSLVEESETLLELGEPGAFDEHGIVAMSAISVGQSVLLYYVGFGDSESGPYRLMIGLAKSEIGSREFTKVSKNPILGPRDGQSDTRGGPFVRRTPSGFEMIYAAGDSWRVQRGKRVPEYELRRIQSVDGVYWPGGGELLLPKTDRYFGYGRPWIHVTESGREVLLLSVRNAEAETYEGGSIAYEEPMPSPDEILFDSSLNDTFQFDSTEKAIFVSSLNGPNSTLFFFNGRDLGRDGLYCSELVTGA